MAEKLVRLSKGAGAPEIEIIIGQAQWGSYSIYLWDQNGLNPDVVGTGINVDQIPDKFTVQKALAALNGAIISWEVSIAAFSSSPGQLYAVTIRITQKGSVVPGGEIVNSGALDGAIFVNDFVRLLVI